MHKCKCKYGELDMQTLYAVLQAHNLKFVFLEVWISAMSVLIFAFALSAVKQRFPYELKCYLCFCACVGVCMKVCVCVQVLTAQIISEKPLALQALSSDCANGLWIKAPTDWIITVTRS